MEVKKSKRLDKFIDNIHNEYVRARYVIKCTKTKRVKRGRSRNISGIAEDLFAELILRSIKSLHFRVFVDQPITLVGKNVTIYPDIVLCRRIDDSNFLIIYLIDLKMDVGFHKKDYTKKANELIKFCKKMKTSKLLKAKIGEIEDAKKERIYFTIDENASYDMVVISSRNSGTPKQEKTLLNYSNDIKSNIWVLSTGQHPNYYIKRNEIKPNYCDWNKLLDKIKKMI